MKINGNIALGILITAVLVVSIFQTMSISSIGEKIKTTGNVVATGSSSSGGIDMSGWTEDEKMMYEHHGTLPARAQGSSSAAMVGGC